MAKQAKNTKTLTVGKYTVKSEVPIFGPKGHITYSGFGAHRDNKNKKNRIQARQEAKRWYSDA